MEAKKRKARFSGLEIDVLVEEVYRNRSTLFSRLCNTVSNENKMTVWQHITESINQVCTVQPRTAEEVRRKWYYYLSDKKKEIAQRKKKTECNSLLVRYTPSDLKILELLGKIEAAVDATPHDAVDSSLKYQDAVEGLVCEVDADALSIRPPSASSDCKPPREHHHESPSCESPTLTCQQDHVTSEDDRLLTAASTPATTTKSAISRLGPASFMTMIPLQQSTRKRQRRGTGDSDRDDSEFLRLDTRRLEQSPTKRQQRDSEDSDRDDSEFVLLERRRLELQEGQLRVLKDIYKQMQTDSERTHSFQQAFLDIQRQRLELERSATQT